MREGIALNFSQGRGRDRKRKGKRGKNFILKWEGYLMRTFSVLHVHCCCLSGMSDQSNSSSNLECCGQTTSSQSPQWGKAPITSMYKKACLTTASNCRVEGSRVSMLSACSSPWARDNYLIAVNLSSLQNWLTELEIFAIIFSAAIHDYEHTGTTNNFHIQTRWGSWNVCRAGMRRQGYNFRCQRVVRLSLHLYVVALFWILKRLTYKQERSLGDFIEHTAFQKPPAAISHILFRSKVALPFFTIIMFTCYLCMACAPLPVSNRCGTGCIEPQMSCTWHHEIHTTIGGLLSN